MLPKNHKKQKIGFYNLSIYNPNISYKQIFLFFLASIFHYIYLKYEYYLQQKLDFHEKNMSFGKVS